MHCQELKKFIVNSVRSFLEAKTNLSCAKQHDLYHECKNELGTYMTKSVILYETIDLRIQKVIELFDKLGTNYHFPLPMSKLVDLLLDFLESYPLERLLGYLNAKQQIVVNLVILLNALLLCLFDFNPKSDKARKKELFKKLMEIFVQLQKFYSQNNIYYQNTLEYPEPKEIDRHLHDIVLKNQNDKFISAEYCEFLAKYFEELNFNKSRKYLLVKKSQKEDEKRKESESAIEDGWNELLLGKRTKTDFGKVSLKGTKRIRHSSNERAGSSILNFPRKESDLLIESVESNSEIGAFKTNRKNTNEANDLVGKQANVTTSRTGNSKKKSGENQSKRLEILRKTHLLEENKYASVRKMVSEALNIKNSKYTTRFQKKNLTDEEMQLMRRQSLMRRLLGDPDTCWLAKHVRFSIPSEEHHLKNQARIYPMHNLVLFSYKKHEMASSNFYKKMTENHRSFAKFKGMINEVNDDTARSHTSHEISLLSNEELFLEHLMFKNALEEERLCPREFLGRLANNPRQRYSLRSSPEKRLSIKDKMLSSLGNTSEDLMASAKISKEDSNKFTSKETNFLSSNYTNSSIRHGKILRMENSQLTQNNLWRRSDHKEKNSGSRFNLEQTRFLSSKVNLFTRSNQKAMTRRRNYRNHLNRCVEDKINTKVHFDVDDKYRNEVEKQILIGISSVAKVNKVGITSCQASTLWQLPKPQNPLCKQKETRPYIHPELRRIPEGNDYSLTRLKDTKDEPANSHFETAMHFDEASSQDSQKEEFRNQMIAMMAEFSRFDLSRTEIVMPLFQRSLSWG